MKHKIIHKYGRLPKNVFNRKVSVIYCTFEPVLVKWQGGNNFQWDKWVDYRWSKVNCAECMRYKNEKSV